VHVNHDRMPCAANSTRRILPTLLGTLTIIVVVAFLSVVGCAGDGAETDTRGAAADTVAESDGAGAAQSGLRRAASADLGLGGRNDSNAGVPGRWIERTVTDEELTPEQQTEIRRLESLGYLAGSRSAPGVGGVTVHDRELAGTGHNFYTSGHFPGALLMDMNGSILHEWRCEFLTAFPDREDLVTEDRTHRWRRAHLYPNGDVLAIFEGAGIIKIDKDSNVLWAADNGAHHDLDVHPDGRIFVLTRRAHVVPEVNRRSPVLEDYVTIMSSDGRELDRVSVLESFLKSDYARALIALDMEHHGDVTHTNTVEILDGRLADRIPAFEADNVLICLRRIDTIAVLDLEAGRIRWLMAGPWLGPHQPTVLPNGNILIFDNGEELEISRVVEFDPVTQETVWQYGGEPEDGFYSKTCGSNALLANGNILVTESDGGRAFEVTRDGTIVWEYSNPARAGDRGQFIAALFEMVRLPEDFPLDWLAP